MPHARPVGSVLRKLEARVAEVEREKDRDPEFRDYAWENARLDGSDRDAFLAELEEHGLRWPQIWDGGGWEAELAVKFHVTGIHCRCCWTPTAVSWRPDPTLAAANSWTRSPP